MAGDLLALPLQELAERIARGESSAEAVVRSCIERIEACEGWVKAWQHFESGLALSQARQLDAQAVSGPLHGIPIGVKDLMDTADMPTTYGSPIYGGHRPVTDAACVAVSRSAGAIVMGKTVTTEFATFQAGRTRNPRNKDHWHTPGGSSSGSAAAVAAGMVPIAFGTQTAGSVIRPAAYCGVVGYKPTYGTLPVTGIKIICPSLDTVGVFSRSVSDAAFFVGALTRLPLMPPPTPEHKLRIGVCHTAHWDRASSDTRRAIANAAQLLRSAGAQVIEISLPEALDGITEAQMQIMGYEIAAAFAPEARTRGKELSLAFAALLEAGQAIDGAVYFAAQAKAFSARQALVKVFAGVDVLVAPSTEGEAPAGLEYTGDPIFNRMWTLLGNPCVHVPLGTGSTGMPVGVTLIGPRWEDARTLAVAQLLEQAAG